MKFLKIPLSPIDPEIYLDCYIADPVGDYIRKAILVIPGGGYGSVCSEREGEPIAMAFLPYGYNAFVLHYSVGRKRPFPAQLIEASAAMKHIRDHAEEYTIDPEKVFVTGFSAGGHLTASLGVLWHRKEIYDQLDMPFGYNKPTGILPIYPVISREVQDDMGCIQGTFYNLLCNDSPTTEELDECSLEKHVDERSSPAFILHTSNDQAVPVAHSLRFANAYAAQNRQFELHIFPDAPHGVALGNAITRCQQPKWENAAIATWIEQAAAWADSL